jgi:hypothetical protein
MKQNVHFMVPAEEFHLLQGEDKLTLYQVCQQGALLPTVHFSPVKFSSAIRHWRSQPACLLLTRSSTQSGQSTSFAGLTFCTHAPDDLLAFTQPKETHG